MITEYILFVLYWEPVQKVQKSVHGFNRNQEGVGWLVDELDFCIRVWRLALTKGLCLCRWGVEIDTSCCQTIRKGLTESSASWGGTWSHLGDTIGRWDALIYLLFLWQVYLMWMIQETFKTDWNTGIRQICPTFCEQVEVGGKTDWDLGVARQSINRKGKIEVTPSNGYWFLSLRDKWVDH